MPHVHLGIGHWRACSRIGETLARAAGLRVLACPSEIPGFTVKQYWHARSHHDSANRWLRGICAELFIKIKISPSLY